MFTNFLQCTSPFHEINFLNGRPFNLNNIFYTANDTVYCALSAPSILVLHDAYFSISKTFVRRERKGSNPQTN